jgi:hypothetical protein
VTVTARSAIERLALALRTSFRASDGKDAPGYTGRQDHVKHGALELLRAAGYFPLMLNPPRGPVPLADQFMEAGVFGDRMRVIFNGIASGAWPFLKLVVIPRTSEQEHKLYLYLREMSRQGLSKGLPDLYLLQPAARAFIRCRTIWSGTDTRIQELSPGVS